MNRLATLLLLLSLGCSTAVHVTAMPDLDAAIACDGAKAVLQARKAAPPKPVTPNGVCDRCGGRGYIGDQASIRVTCPACGGSGKTTCTTGQCPERR